MAHEHMAREDIETLVRGLYAKRLGNTIETVPDYFSDDSRFTLNGCPMASPIALSLSGKSAIAKLLGELFAAWEWQEQTIHGLLIDGDRVAVHYRLKVRFVPTGEIVATEICDVLTVQAGKITELIQFIDTALISRLMTKHPAANAA